MSDLELQKWLAEPRTVLVTAVADCVRAHVDKLRSSGVEFYAYALHAFEPYEIRINAAAINTEADIKVPHTDPQYPYYRYTVDEWPRWDHDGFASANALFAKAHEQFAALHPSTPGDYDPDEFELAHRRVLLEAIVRGLEVAKAGGVFGNSHPFMVVWFSDVGNHPIIVESVRRLNPVEVATKVIRAYRGIPDSVPLDEYPEQCRSVQQFESTADYGQSQEEPLQPEASTIYPGHGLEECHIGGSIQDALKLFGKPSTSQPTFDEDGQPERYDRFIFTNQGVEIVVEQGRIKNLFFFYRSKTYQQYDGTTEEGIGKDSSVEHVVNQYGKPDRVSKTVESKFGEYPGAQVHEVNYHTLGIAFTFYDGKIAQVSVWAKSK